MLQANPSWTNLLVLAEGVGLGAEVGRGRANIAEVAAKGRRKERTEDELSTAIE